MSQSVAVMLFTAIALGAWALLAQSLRLGRRRGAGVFIAMGTVLALLTTTLLIQAQVREPVIVEVLVRFQLALRLLTPSLWVIALLRWAEPPFIRGFHLAAIAIPALALGTAAIVTPIGGPMILEIARSASVPWAVDVATGPWVWFAGVPFGFLMLVSALALIALTPLEGRGIGRGAMSGWFFATATTLATAVVQVAGLSPLPGHNATGVALGVMVAVLHVTLVTTPAFARRERAFRAAFDAMHEPALVVASDGTVLEANTAAVRLLGDGDELGGGNLAALAPQLEAARRRSRGDAVGHRLEGELAGFEASITSAQPGVGVGPASVIVLHDRRRDRAREAQLLERAFRDDLTGVVNRRGFEDTLSRALADRRGRAVGLVYVDLDGFKAVNDTLGHAAGDAVLIEVARRLEAVVRDGDVVARLGGDEFALVLFDVVPAGLAAVAERASSAVARSIVTDEGIAKVGASLGLASAPRDGTTLDAVLHAADERMYRQKRAKPDRDARMTLPGVVEPPERG